MYKSRTVNQNNELGSKKDDNEYSSDIRVKKF